MAQKKNISSFIRKGDETKKKLFTKTIKKNIQ